MEIINPFYLYLILQLDSIKDFMTGAGAIAFAAGVLAALFTSIHISTELSYKKRMPNIYDGDESLDGVRKVRKASGVGAVAGVLVLAANSLLPTSERMAVLVVLPAVANNEAVQAEAKEVYDLAKRGLAKLIEEPTTPTTTEENK